MLRNNLWCHIKKIKNYLQKGNELFLEYNSKNENALGYFKVEIINPHTSKFFSDRKKTKLHSINTRINKNFDCRGSRKYKDIQPY